MKTRSPWHGRGTGGVDDARTATNERQTWADEWREFLKACPNPPPSCSISTVVRSISCELRATETPCCHDPVTVIHCRDKGRVPIRGPRLKWFHEKFPDRGDDGAGGREKINRLRRFQQRQSAARAAAGVVTITTLGMAFVAGSVVRPSSASSARPPRIAQE